MPSVGPEGFLPLLRQTLDSLRDAERRAAEFILEHPLDVIHLSINVLAEQAGVSDATVFRLCRRLGFSGYQALKIALAREVEAAPVAIYEAVADTDSPLAVAQKVFQASVQSLTDTQRLLSEQTLEAAVRALSTARKVEFYGVGGSGAVAVDAMHKFMRTGLQCAAHADSHLQMMGASLLEPGDVAVGISHSGNSKDVVEALQVAKGAGATTIAITNQTGTPLVKVADLALYTASGETGFWSVAMASRLAQLALVDCLFVAVSLARQESARSSIRRIRTAIALKRY